MRNSFIKKILNKEYEDISLQDLEIYFESEQQETSILEFKSGDVEIIDIYKEVTAFLNTEGGLSCFPRCSTQVEIKQKFQLIAVAHHRS